jgi:hypothetical protein
MEINTSIFLFEVNFKIISMKGMGIVRKGIHQY